MSTPKHSIEIIVSDTDYNMYGDISTRINRLWTTHLAKLVKKAGGINHKVEPGVYKFFVSRKGLALYTNLIKQN